MDRYEITLDADEDVVMESEGIEEAEEDGQLRRQPVSMTQLKSTVVRRRGRGFDESNQPQGLTSECSFEKVSADGTQSCMTLPSGGTLAERSVEGWTVFLAGVHEEAAEDDLLDKLSDYGHVKDLRLAMDHRTGFAKGYAIAEFREYREARAAIEGMDGRPFMGQPIKVDFAFIRPIV